MGLRDVDIDALLAGEIDPEQIRQLLTEGKSAYTSAQKLGTKNQEILAEKKSLTEKVGAFESALSAKGITIEDLENYNPNPGNDELVAKFQKQLKDTQAVAAAETARLQKELGAAKEESDLFRQKMDSVEVRQSYLGAAEKAGILPQFREDFEAVLRARGIDLYKTEGGVKGKRSGDVVDYDLDVLLTTLKNDERFGHYFEGSFGGGSGSTGGGGQKGVNNPFATENWNVQEQSRIYRESPEKAAQLKALASGS